MCCAHIICGHHYCVGCKHNGLQSHLGPAGLLALSLLCMPSIHISARKASRACGPIALLGLICLLCTACPANNKASTNCGLRPQSGRPYYSAVHCTACPAVISRAHYKRRRRLYSHGLCPLDMHWALGPKPSWACSPIGFGL